MFLALMNSVDDIIRDRVVLHRERNLDVRLPYYIFAKFITLALFSAVQCALFVVVGNSILEVRGMFWPYFIFMFITATSGTSLGLIISLDRRRLEDCGEFRPACTHPSAHLRRSAHQVRGDEPGSGCHLHF